MALNKTNSKIGMVLDITNGKVGMAFHEHPQSTLAGMAFDYLHAQVFMAFDYLYVKVCMAFDDLYSSVQGNVFDFAVLYGRCGDKERCSEYK